MAHWDGASAAFEALGVDLTRSTTVDGARTAVRGAFRAKAEARLSDKRDGLDDDSWDGVVKAKAEALAALDRFFGGVGFVPGRGGAGASP